MIAHILAVALLSPEVGSFPTWLGDETYQPVTACPDLTSEEEAGRQELRRRYCERFGCGAEGSPPPSA